MNYFLGIDLGTSYCKAGVFDENGKLYGLGRHFVEKHTGNGTLSELSVVTFWKTLRLSVQDALKESNISPGDISSLSFSSQANSFILLDKADNPLTPIILWTDNRADELIEPLHILINRADFITKTGLGIQPGNQSLIAKIDWFQKKELQIWEKVKRIVSISDYLTFSLTGHFVSDTSTSSMTGLLNISEGQWWEEAISLFQIEIKQLPEPQKMGIFIGYLTEKGATRIGLSQHTRLFSGGLDHHMVAIGSGVIRSSEISESTGTVLACVNYQKGYSPLKGVNIAQGPDHDHFFQMVFENNGAVALEWYQQAYAAKSTIPELLKLAAEIDPTCNGLIARPNVNNYSGLNGFVHITKEHRDAHFIRAILESTGVSLLELVKRLEGEYESKRITSSGGGAKSRLWLQIKADMLNKCFVVPETEELACKGAAMLCAVGTKCFSSLDEAIEKQIRSKETIYPDPKRSEIYREWYRMIKTIKYE